MCVYIYIGETSISVSRPRQQSAANPSLKMSNTHPWDKINGEKRWLKFHGDIFIREVIFPDNLIHHCYKEDEEYDWMFKQQQQNFFMENNNNLPKNKSFTKLFSDDDDDDGKKDYYINNIFEKNFTTLTKNLENLKKYHRCNFYLLLGEIFNICRIVALDLKNEFLISIYNKKLYIIMYNENLYISLKLEDNADGFDDDENNGSLINIHRFVKRFIHYNNKSDVLNRVKAVEEDEDEEEDDEEAVSEPSTPSLSSSSFAIFNTLFGGYFSTSTRPPPLQQQQQQQTLKDDIITNWDNWGPTPKDFFTWEYVDYNRNDMYIRKNIHYKKSLRDIFIYNNNNDAIITNKDTSIQKLKKMYTLL